LNEAFFTLHQGLPREGPGEPVDVRWAIEVAGTRGPVRVLDAGCGPGADLVTLAEALPEAHIEGVDVQSSFVSEAMERVSKFGNRFGVRVGEMATVRGPYALIWCASAAYFLGVTEVLARWRAALAPGGRVALSEVVWIGDDPAPVLREFWQEYPAMSDVAGLRARIAAAGYEILGERLLSETAWEAYYGPLEARIATLRRGPVTQALAEVLEDAETEIALRRQFPGDFGYLLTVVAPT